MANPTTANGQPAQALDFQRVGADAEVFANVAPDVNSTSICDYNQTELHARLDQQAGLVRLPGEHSFTGQITLTADRSRQAIIGAGLNRTLLTNNGVASDGSPNPRTLISLALKYGYVGSQFVKVDSTHVVISHETDDNSLAIRLATVGAVVYFAHYDGGMGNDPQAEMSVLTAVSDGGMGIVNTTIPYTFSTTTTDADPGNGILRLNQSTQNTATVIRADLLDSAAADRTALLDTFDDSSNTVKGMLLLTKISDPTHFLAFYVTALATPSGYRNITCVCYASSSANPFSNSDAVNLQWKTSISWTLGTALTSNITSTFGGGFFYKTTANGAICSVSGSTITFATTARAADFEPYSYHLLATGPVFNEIRTIPVFIYAVDTGAGTATMAEALPEGEYVAGLTCLIPGSRTIPANGLIENTKIEDMSFDGTNAGGSIYTVLLANLVGGHMKRCRTVNVTSPGILDSLFLQNSRYFVYEDVEGVFEFAGNCDCVWSRCRIWYLNNHLNNRRHTFRNCLFFGDIIGINGFRQITFINCQFWGAMTATSGGAGGGECSDLQFLDCYFHNTGSGWIIDGPRIVFRNCHNVSGNTLPTIELRSNCTNSRLDHCYGLNFDLKSGSGGRIHGIDDAFIADETGGDWNYTLDAPSSFGILPPEAGAAPGSNSTTRSVVLTAGKNAGYIPVYELSPGYYHLSEVSSTDATDSSGSGNTLTQSGTVPTATALATGEGSRGPFSSSNLFSATNTPFTIPVNGKLLVRVLLKLTDNSDHHNICGIRGASAPSDSQWNIGFNYLTNRLHATVYGANSGTYDVAADTFGNVPLNTLIRMVVLFDNTGSARQTSIWINNQGSPDTGVWGDALNTPSALFYLGWIGTTSSANAWAGTLGGLRFLYRAWTSDELDADYRSGDYGVLPVVPSVDGSYLTDLNASNVTTGTLPIAQGGTGNTKGSPKPLFDYYADVSSTHVDGTFDNLVSATIPAAQLAANGEKLTAEFTVSYVSSATATRQTKASFGGTTILDTTALTFSSTGTAVIRLTIFRVTSGSVRCTAEFIESGITSQPKITTTDIGSLTLSNTQTLTVTAAAASTGAASADIVLKSGLIAWSPAA